MRVFKLVFIGVAAASFIAQAKNTYTVFSLGPAWPVSGSAAPVDTMGDTKKLGPGWNGSWTFFGLPFSKSGTALSGLGFGGKISYGRWERDSTFTEINFLGTQAIVRYYVPLTIKPFDLFVQAGGGMFIGYHGFTDPDTLNLQYPPTTIQVTKGIKNTGVSFNIGMDWDVIELSPGMTMVFTKRKTSAWFEIDAAMKF
ncbi:MAG: hypothetical protein ABSF80_09180 [Chitinispirillaceae bacterium]|jgi:hypothetical protein